MVGQKYSAIAFWPWGGDLNIAEITFLKKSYTTNSCDRQKNETRSIAFSDSHRSSAEHIMTKLDSDKENL